MGERSGLSAQQVWEAHLCSTPIHNLSSLGHNIARLASKHAQQPQEASLVSLAGKLQEHATASSKLFATAKARLNHEQLINHSEEALTELQTARMISDWMLRKGYFESASLFDKFMKLGALSDTGYFVSARKIIAELRSGKVDKCLHWCGVQRGKLTSIGSSLEVDLRISQFLDLLEKNELDVAIQHARAHFPSTYQDIELRKKICSVMGVLASNNIAVAIDENFNRNERFGILEAQFLDDFLEINGLCKKTFLERLLSVGKKCVDLGSCSQGNVEIPSFNCPACYVQRDRENCVDDLERLKAEEIPLKFKLSRSHLVCAISGRIMDGDNLPMALPNGQVYSSRAIKQASQSGVFTCPKTNATYKLEDCKPVYVL
eukprot:TRINITY_DN25691_c0_g1_i4.p1 TRINITY_DN25691_c0_g1~~TRINITY_DN25691_c0_g1_i4.p1  ORF type:complete len:417 (+),score=95.28 TRINITY_DN25691_c0_g1_i4:128-1252(+)